MSDTTTQPTVWTLAHMAEVASPDNVNSPGAEWLTQVYGAGLEVAESIRDKDWTVSAMLEDGDALDLIHESADQIVPIYTHNLWAVFVDLAAYQEDVEEYGDSEDLTQSAMVALFIIARRLIESTLEDIAQDERTETGA